MAIFSSASYQMLLLVSLLLVIALIVFRKQLHLSSAKVNLPYPLRLLLPYLKA
jgi:hypothetical protein